LLFKDRHFASKKHINHNLEEQARLLFEYWFVQFDFPSIDGKPYRSSGGEMIWNDRLQCAIPKMWSVENIQQVCSIVDCLHSKKPEFKYEGNDYYLLETENLTKDGNVDATYRYYITKEDYNKWTKNIEVQEGDFLITNAGRAGDMCMVPKGVKCAIGRNITAIRPKELSHYYLNQYFKSAFTRRQIQQGMELGVFFLCFNVRNVKQLEILIPENTVYKHFLSKITGIIQEQDIVFRMIQILNKQKEDLLPLLINGQISSLNYDLSQMR